MVNITKQGTSNMRLIDINKKDTNKLNEVNMSPGFLFSMVKNIDARIGIEYEMIVPNDRSDDDMKRDMHDYPNSLNEINDKFDDNDLVYLIEEDYLDWKSRKVSEDFLGKRREYIEDYVYKITGSGSRLNRSGAGPSMKKATRYEKALATHLQKVMEIDVSSVIDVFDLRVKKSNITNSAEFPQLILDNSAANDNLSAATKVVDGKFDAEIQDAVTELNGNSLYDEALEDLMAQSLPDWEFEDFALDQDLTYAEILGRYPTSYDGENYDNQNFLDQISNSIDDEFDNYTVEDDSSLQPDNDMNELGIEIISPPLSFVDTKEDFQRMMDYMETIGAYVNDSCGLHINVSLPGKSMDQLDLTKLMLFVGDNYILNAFSRQANSYAMGSLNGFLNKNLQGGQQAMSALDSLKTSLNSKAGNYLQSNMTGKYTSINIQSNRVEFRGPGGEWTKLGPLFIFATIARLIFALHVSMDETLYQKEYAKMLYKVIGPDQKDKTAVSLFVQYTSGILNKQELKTFLNNRKSWRPKKDSSNDQSEADLPSA
jgi:hypothetical protein